VDEDDLLRALDTGLSAAVLDVRAVEPPPPGDRLLQHPRVRHSPHVAGLTRESSLRIASRVLSGIAAVLSAKTP
jgi:phosphoglycerate dehydrogenase-like enzyme